MARRSPGVIAQDVVGSPGRTEPDNTLPIFTEAEAIRFVKQGIEEHIAQNTPEALAQKVLDNHGIAPHFARRGGQLIALIAEGIRLSREVQQ